jgi:pimeloyl-ACP methyl ester carboxylesterase
MVSDMARSPGFTATFDATLHRHYSAEPELDVPTTVAFGSRDRLLLRQSRHVEQLPRGATRQVLHGCGHVPMSDDPDAVVAVITAGVHRAHTTV